MTRDINVLHPYVKQLCQQFVEECRKQNIVVQITGTLRTFAEQDALYAQGRTKPGGIVTNAKGGQSYHNYGLAFDYVPVVNGVAVWNNDILWNKCGVIGEKLGLLWGGRWSTLVDKPHMQWSGGLTLKDLQAGKKPVTPAPAKPATTTATKPAAPVVVPKPAPITKKVIVGTLNVRPEANTAKAPLGSLKKGDKVTCTSTASKNGNWTQIDYKGKTAYVWSEYIG